METKLITLCLLIFIPMGLNAKEFYRTPGWLSFASGIYAVTGFAMDDKYKFSNRNIIIELNGSTVIIGDTAAIAKDIYRQLLDEQDKNYKLLQAINMLKLVVLKEEFTDEQFDAILRQFGFSYETKKTNTKTIYEQSI